MKKIALFLAGLMLLTFLITACNKSDNENSENGSSSESSDESIPESSSDEESSEEVSEVPYIPMYYTPVSIGKKYTGTSPDTSYPDTFNSELTDGLYSDLDKSYTDPKWSSYLKPDPVYFNIDLEEDGLNLNRFEVSYYHDPGPGIVTPLNIKVFCSDDGEKWTLLCTIASSMDSESGIYKVSKDLKEPVDSRYIRYEMSHYSAHIFLDELTVYADVPGADSSGEMRSLIETAFIADSYDYSAALKTAYTLKTDYTLPLLSVSGGCSYNASRSASQKYPDSSKLTDSKPLRSTYESGNWVGFEGSEGVDITVDLKKVHNDISYFKISAMQNIALGIPFPLYVDVLISENNKDFTKIGRIYAPLSNNIDNYQYILSLSSGVKARYVRFSFPEQERSYLFFEEVNVSAYREDTSTPKQLFYKEEPVPVITAETLFPSASADYNTHQNLIKGLTQRIYSFYPIYKGQSGNSTESEKMLTDGVYGTTAKYSASGFFKFGGGEGRDVVYDFGATVAVDSFKVSFLREDPVGINHIGSVMFYLSDNGVDWYGVSAAALPSENGTEFLRAEVALGETYKARYARFSFRVWPNAYCDELEVLGTKNASQAKSLSQSGIKSSLMDAGAYVERDKYLGGANDIVLIPNYAGEKERQGLKNLGFSKEELLAYAAYLDRNGNILDVMFDGFLFCPTGSLLEGGHGYKNSTMKEVKDMYDKTFAQGRDIYALEEAVADIVKELNLKDYKVQIYISLCYPAYNYNFGDLDGDGKSDILDTEEKRFAAVQWQMDYFLSLFNEAALKYVDFGGFYWVHEGMNSVQADYTLLKDVSDYSHKLGYDIYWIPYYKAAGFEQWQLLGFDLACMQPNFAFNANVDSIYAEYCAVLTKRLGMCVEMEITGAALTDPVFFDKYMRYLTAGDEFGYMKETVHIYYQDLLNYYNSCYAEDDKGRLVYDYTYDFIKGELKMNPDKPKADAYITDKNTIYEDTFNSSKSNGLEYFATKSPENGTITVAPDGSFMYYPQEGFTGTDEFGIAVTNYLGESETTVIKITVK